MTEDENRPEHDWKTEFCCEGHSADSGEPTTWNTGLQQLAAVYHSHHGGNPTEGLLERRTPESSDISEIHLIVCEPHRSED